MAFKKGHPKIGGRKPGSINKLTVGRRLAEAKAKEADPDGMGHAYEGLWWLAQQYRLQIQDEMNRPKVSLLRLVAAQERLGRTLTDLLPFERPKLKSITFKEPDTSPRVRADLNLLTNAELDLLEKLCLKASAGHTAPGLPGDADHQSPGGKIKARGARRTR